MTHRSRVFRAVLATLAIGCALPSAAHAQPVAKANFIVDGSFALATAGEASVQNPVTLAWAAGNQIHIAGEKGPVVVVDGTGKFVRSYGATTLKKVASVRVDASGLAYVLDPELKTVFVFDPAGQVKYRIGSPGSGGGQLADPIDMALGPTGLVYVLDKGRKGVQVFGLEGTFLHDLLLPIEAEEPQALAVAPDGRVYVADKKLIGTLVRLPDLTVALSTADAAPPQTDGVRLRGATMKEPIALVATSTGTIAAADRETGIVWSVDGAGAQPVGTDDRVYGGSGSGRGSFRKIEDIALAGTDELLILDGDGRKVERIKLVLEGQRRPQATMDYPVQFQTLPPPLAQGVLATAARRNGNAWYAIADAEGRNLRVVEAKLVDKTGVFGNRIRLPEALPGNSTHGFGTVVEKAGFVALNDTLMVVSEPGKNRFHVIDLRTDASIGAFGDNYRDDRRLRDPRGVALFADGRIAIADHGNDRIAVFSADVASLLGTVPLLKAQGVAVSPDGRLFAWDEEGINGSRLPPNGGTFVGLPPSLSTGGIGALTVDGAGNLYSLRRGSSRVAILGSGMDRLLARVGAQRGVENGDHLTVDADGNIYATDVAKGTTVVTRWGVDVPAIRTLSSVWSKDAATLTWEGIPGSFVTGYQLEAAPSADGPWSRVSVLSGTTTQVKDPVASWYRVAARTLTGAVGQPSPAAPASHLAALAAFRAKDWTRAQTLATDALTIADKGLAKADDPTRLELRYGGLVSAHELKDYNAVDRWFAMFESDQGDPAPYTFDILYRMSDTRQKQGLLEDAVGMATTALENATGAPPEQLATLRQTVFDIAWELKEWYYAADMGDQILRVGKVTDPSFIERVARAHLENENPSRARDLIESALVALEAAPDAQRKHRLDMLSVVVATQLEDHASALMLAGTVGSSLDSDLFVLYEGALANARLRTGDRSGARFELMSLVQDPRDALALTDPMVARTALAVYGSYLEAAQPDVGKAMLDSLLAVLPADQSEARAAILQGADSTAAVADTRVKLGAGFKLYTDALFRDALRFFQTANARTDLDIDQRLIVKELLAGVLYSFQRVPDADEVYRGVFEVDPDFNLFTHLEHVAQVYGITVFADEVLEHFNEVGPLR